MSIDLLRSRAVDAIKTERATILQRLRLCRPRSPAIHGGEKSVAVVPPAGVEEIALFAVDINATVDAYDRAISIIENEFKKIIEPEQPAEEGQARQGDKFYG